jgi:transposase-like protein
MEKLIKNMENGLRNILRKKEKNTRKEIPNRIINDNMSEIPDKIRVIYENKINIQHIKEVITHRLKMLKDFENLKIFLQKELEFSKIYNEHKSKDASELYLDFCSKYIIIERIKNISNEFKCKGCGVNLEDLNEEREGFLVCDICNCINSYLIPNQYVRDIEKHMFYIDEDTNNFIKILDKFEGKTNLILDKFFFDKLDEYFLEIGGVTGEEIRKLPLNDKGKKDGTSRKILWGAVILNTMMKLVI